MKTETELHPIQFEILRYLMFHVGAKFSELNTQKLPTDHFTFHLKALVAEDLIEKNGNKYDLTLKGKEFGNRLDTEKSGVEKQAKVSVLIVGRDKDKYLIQQRLKQPYYGFYGFFGGKIKYGDTPLETAKRELFEETGLVAKKLELRSVGHKMDYTAEGKLLEDKYFFVFKAEGFSGEFITDFEGGKNLWLTKEEILKLPNLFDGVEATMTAGEKAGFSYREKKYIVKGF
jgi:8-oxo-dGTP pyrophosphatase MutT (NUDIX family)